MSIVAEWSIRLAHEVAPDEIELAPLIAQAFIEGGEARRELFAKSGNMLGGFSAGDVATIMPFALRAVSFAGLGIASLLTSPLLVEFLACIKGALTIQETRLRVKNRENQPQAGSPLGEPLIPPRDIYKPLREITEVIGRELRGSGIGDDHSDLLTFRILKALMEDPKGASEFVQQLIRAPST
jgi:hypothetical protein